MYWFAFPALRPKQDVVAESVQPIAEIFGSEEDRKSLAAAVSAMRPGNPLTSAFLIQKSTMTVQPINKSCHFDWSAPEVGWKGRGCNELVERHCHW